MIMALLKISVPIAISISILLSLSTTLTLLFLLMRIIGNRRGKTIRFVSFISREIEITCHVYVLHRLCVANVAKGPRC